MNKINIVLEHFLGEEFFGIIVLKEIRNVQDINLFLLMLRKSELNDFSERFDSILTIEDTTYSIESILKSTEFETYHHSIYFLRDTIRHYQELMIQLMLPDPSEILETLKELNDKRNMIKYDQLLGDKFILYLERLKLISIEKYGIFQACMKYRSDYWTSVTSGTTTTNKPEDKVALIIKYILKLTFDSITQIRETLGSNISVKDYLELKRTVPNNAINFITYVLENPQKYRYSRV